ncbi:Uncharacterized membrane protein [Caldanaerovirga acetigignens]|uniref:Uncharacterized membrane protein n=1 Tax=Caldanaerovirga acetigignens TaxID=447595 RepID=A0A1M7M7H3_9FIRM|nr:QueT transporter family protein [Caldanaerovirga acetigignens]SHM86631.1 Uncharacterized membrane protein [Caldanaerovirga acetigignens]
MPKKMSDVAQISLIACLYVVLTIISSSFSYLPSQFRLGEIIKPISTFDRKFAVSMMVGNFLSNLFSPYAGPMELLFMPISNLVGCTLGYYVGRYTRRIFGAVFIALWISASVAVTLKVSAGFPLFHTFLSVSAAEIVLLVSGCVVMEQVLKRGGIING